jgi:prophage regulatory protein
MARPINGDPEIHILRADAVVDRVGLSRSRIYALISIGAFPRPIHLGQKSVGWVQAEINDWLKSRIAARDAPARRRKRQPKHAEPAVAST